MGEEKGGVEVGEVMCVSVVAFEGEKRGKTGI